MQGNRPFPDEGRLGSSLDRWPPTLESAPLQPHTRRPERLRPAQTPAAARLIVAETHTLPDRSLGHIPDAVIVRLPLYLRAIRELGVLPGTIVTSSTLGEQAGIPPTQVRKDLSFFGHFGRQGRGYSSSELEKALKTILGLDHNWNVAVIGMGRLGRALISYPEFIPQGFSIRAAFDSDKRRVNTVVRSMRVRPLSDLSAAVQRLDIAIAIITVSDRLQHTVDVAVESGIRAILNYAPVHAQVPDQVQMRRIDPILALQSMTYYLTQCQD